MLSVCVKDNKSHSTRHALWVLLCALVLTLYHGLTRCVCTMRGHGVWAWWVVGAGPILRALKELQMDDGRFTASFGGRCVPMGHYDVHELLGLTRFATASGRARCVPAV